MREKNKQTNKKKTPESSLLRTSIFSIKYVIMSLDEMLNCEWISGIRDMKRHTIVVSKYEQQTVQGKVLGLGT